MNDLIYWFNIGKCLFNCVLHIDATYSRYYIHFFFNQATTRLAAMFSNVCCSGCCSWLKANKHTEVITVGAFKQRVAISEYIFCMGDWCTRNLEHTHTCMSFPFSCVHMVHKLALKPAHTHAHLYAHTMG